MRNRRALIAATIPPVFLLTASAAANASPWLEVAGRAHVAIVHFPVGLIAGAVVFELVRIVAKGTKPSPAALGCTLLAILGGVAAAASGWLHADAEQLSGNSDLELHRWVAIAATAFALIAAVFGLIARKTEAQTTRRLYVLALFIAGGGTMFASHLGGELVWGRGYLWQPLMPAAPTQSNTDDALTQPLVIVGPVDFDAHLLPIFNNQCIECHGPRKQNGKLRLDSYDELMASPYIDDVLTAGEPDISTLYERIILPEDHRDFMPKRGKKLPDDRIDAIRRWIAEGAMPPMGWQSP